MRTERTVTIAIPLSLSRVLGLELPPGDWNFGDFVFIAKMESCLFVNSYCREKGLNECFTLAAIHNPDYILMLDADEIPTPSIITFLENI